MRDDIGRPPRWLRLAGVLWFVIALVLGGTGRVAALRPPAPQLVLGGLTVGLLLLGRTAPGVRGWLRTLDPRATLTLHLTRFVGIYFLVLHRRGELPGQFAVPGGWGDIAVASLALVLLLVPAEPKWWRAAVIGWNVLGLLDILFVVATAARLATADPGSMAAMLRLPLSLLPTFLVPLIIATHVWLFARLRQTATGG